MVRLRTTAKPRCKARPTKEARNEKRIPKLESLERRELLAAEIMGDTVLHGTMLQGTILHGAGVGSQLGAEVGSEAPNTQAPDAHGLFAPGTSSAVIAAWGDRVHGHDHGPGGAASPAFEDSGDGTFGSAGGTSFEPIILGSRWRTSALGTAPNQGDPITLTWSIVADGTSIGTDNQTGDSNLVAFMDGVYGGGGTDVISEKPWFGLYVRAFEAWAGTTGLSFQYEPNDDGAEVANEASVGVAGVRADIRISGAAVDGNANVLAFNYLPIGGGFSGFDGDMVIDTSDNFYARSANIPSGENRGLVNVLTHEIGHGIGLSHVLPINGSKLLEPIINFGFSGPQEDDIYNAHRLYGDTLEPNDLISTAFDLGELQNEVRELTGLSIDNGLTDIDLFRFEVTGPTALSLEVAPTGTTYLEGSEDGPPPVLVDRLREMNLGFRILASDGVSELLAVDAVPEGLTESVEGFGLFTPGVYFIEVNGNAGSQLYSLALRIGRTIDLGTDNGSLRLVSVNPNADEVFDRDDLNLRSTSPNELTFRFSADSAIDPSTIANGIRIFGAGNDNLLGTRDDVIVTPGFIGLGDNDRTVVARFAQPLPDSRYRVEVFGVADPLRGIEPLRQISGEAFSPTENGTASDSIDFELELGARVVSVVPQPIVRTASGTLDHQRRVVHVYFDDNDLFAGGGTASLRTPDFYQLIRTADTIQNTDDQRHLPTSVNVVEFETFQEANPSGPIGSTLPIQVRVNRVELTFEDDLENLSGTGAFRLKVGGSDPVAVVGTPSQVNVLGIQAESGDTFADAIDLPAFGLTPTIILEQSIVDTGLPFDFPGSRFEPGQRDIGEEDHFFGTLGIRGALGDTTTGLHRVEYNFALTRSYGLDSFGNPLFNVASPIQIDRFREVFELFGNQAGIDFVETESAGLTVVVGDMFPAGGTPSGPGGTIGVYFGTGNSNGTGDGIVIMDGAENWYNGYGRSSTPQPSFFLTALHEIGHAVGLGHTYDLPDGTIQGNEEQYAGSSTEWRFPGDHDIVHTQFLYRPDNQDVDLYRFTPTENGTLRAETFAERRQGGSLLNTHLMLYRDTSAGPILVASNDDLYGTDSLIEFELQSDVTYFVGVTAHGNEDFDGNVDDTGSGGDSQGDYQLRINFTPQAGNAILDAAGTPIDGDGDGVAGGEFNFWFRAAPATNTIYVDASNPGIGTGTLADPFSQIDSALAASQPGQIVRIVGNAGADGVIGLPGDDFAGNDDNLAYEIGRIDSLSQTLDDGRDLIVPRGVTVMVDAGAVFKMLGSRIAVGSGDAGNDNSGAAFQVLGVPHLPVFFTSLNDNDAGLEVNPLLPGARPGDWGGIDIRNGNDRAEGRTELEREGIFLNYISGADIRYGGGQVRIDGQLVPIAPVRLDAARPTLLGNSFRFNADAAISADPPSFEENTFTTLQFQRDVLFVPDYDRVGPVIYGNEFIQNSINGLLVRIDTIPGVGREQLSTAARFDDTEVVHVLGDDLLIQGNSGGAIVATPAGPLTLAIVETVATTSQGSSPGIAPGRYSYAMSLVDRFGVETEPSPATAGVEVVAGRNIRIRNLPAAPDGFVSRRLYRQANGTGPFELVAELNRANPTFIDNNANTIDIAGPGGTTLKVTPINNPVDGLRTRPDARLVIDPGITVKSSGVRIETGFGADLIAEGVEGRPVIFTSRTDDRYGAGGNFDTTSNGFGQGDAGDWAGIFANPFGRLSLDHVLIANAGGVANVGGTSAGFNAIGILQADARISNTTFERTASGVGGNDAFRVGRGPNDPSIIHIVGAQPVIVDNTFIDTQGDQTSAISINVNALIGVPLNDFGRQSGGVALATTPAGNYGPLVSGNRIEAGGIAGLWIRPEILNTGVVFDDTDIVHVVSGEIIDPNLHTFGGLRLQSRASESLVVKFSGSGSLTADGRPNDVDDRIGGSVHIVGAPGFPVVLTSLTDDSVGAGFDPQGRALLDTDGTGPTSGIPGAWRGIELLEFSNDRNVETTIELEGRPSLGGDINATVASAQPLGQLGRGEKASDETLRLGFTVYGTIASPGDVDTYTFTAAGGQTVWVDIDRTGAALDSVVEVLNGTGDVIASSDNSHAESLGLLSLGGDGLPMQQSAFGLRNTDGTARDSYTTNPLDAGLRVNLPGAAGVTQEYFVRVRGNSNTTGAYQAQVRLRELDEFGGSTVRYSDIRFATVGILTSGLPTNSPLTGEGTSNGTTAVNLGNIANSNRAAISVSGVLTEAIPVNTYTFRIERDSVQSGGDATYIATTFDIDYADGFGRPDTTLLLYRETGLGLQLIMLGTDSNIASDRPGPGATQLGDQDDLARGSAGPRDAFLGTVELAAGDYQLVVTSNAVVPAEIADLLEPLAANPNLRIEPVSSTIRIAEDRFGDARIGNATAIPTPQDVVFQGEDNAIPFTLGDTTLFIASNLGNNTRLTAHNPQVGDIEAFQGVGNRRLGAIAMRPDGTLFGSAGELTTGTQTETDDNVGQLFTIDENTGALTATGMSTGIETFEAVAGTFAVEASAGGDGDGIQFNALTFAFNNPDNQTGLRLWGVGGRGNGQLTFNTLTAGPGIAPAPAQNFIYRLDPDTGAAISTAAGGPRTGDSRASGAGTDVIEAARIAVNDPNDPSTELQFIVTGFAAATDGDFYAVTDTGLLIRVPGDSFGDATGVRNGNTPVVGELVTTITVTNATGVTSDASFTGLTAGPRNVPGFADLLFATDNNGRIHAFATDGTPQGLVGPSVETGLGATTGLAFSTLDFNLWHRTSTRGNDGGHGSLPTVDGARESIPGQNSLRFGFETSGVVGDWIGNNPVNAGVPTRSEGTYDFPGGAQGQVESFPVDLSGYAPEDRPTLYFNYFLNTEDANARVNDADQARDSFRVYISSEESPQWALVGTNNIDLLPTGSDFTDDEDEYDVGQSNFVDQNGQYQFTQPLHDSTDWLQARISLAAWAGHNDIRIRFDFNTAGEPEVNALELRAVSPQRIFDEASLGFSLDGRDASNQPLLANFVFDFGLVLQLPSGGAIENGSSFEIFDVAAGSASATTVTFTTGAATDPFDIVYAATDSPSDIAQRLAAQLGGTFDVTIDPENLSRISIRAVGGGAADVSGINGFNPTALVLDQPNDPATLATDTFLVNVAIDMTATQVRDAMRESVALAYSGSATNLLPYQAFGETLRLFGFNVTDAGPLRTFGGYSPDTGTIDLPGSNSGVYGGAGEAGFNGGNPRSVAAGRGLNNNFQGVFIDDVIIGFAERGEMILGATIRDTDLSANPQFQQRVGAGGEVRPEISLGQYQLEIRQSADYGDPVGANFPSVHQLVSTFDTNTPHDRLIALRFFDAGNDRPINGATIPDGEFIRISDGVNTIEFEFEDFNSTALTRGVTPGRVMVPFSASDSAADLTLALIAAINSPAVQARLGVSASTLGGQTSQPSGGDTVLLHGPAAATILGDLGDAFTSDPARLPISVIQFGVDLPGEDQGDANRFRDQGQIILQANTISDSSGFGILVDAGARSRLDVSDLSSTTLPRPGSNRSFLVQDTQLLAPGVVIVNNVLVGNNAGGVLISGDTGGPVPAPQGFARVVNNTIYGDRSGDVGIRVEDRAAATLLNNAVANLATGVQVAGAVNALEQFGTIFFNNISNTAGTGLGASPLAVGTELFLNPDNRNFYPSALSSLIDTAVGSVDDRVVIESLRLSLGIASSPIIAPERDITGQRRVDGDGGGIGSGPTVFIDRGAIDRSDIAGPLAGLVDPLDLLAPITDRSPESDRDGLETFVRLVSGNRDQFLIQLQDVNGAGIDDLTVTSERVIVTENGRRLVAGIDYRFAYLDTSNRILLTPTSGIWSADAAYEITLNNRSRIVMGVPNGRGIFDGEQFTVTDSLGRVGTFEYDSGFVVQVAQTLAIDVVSSADQFVDRETFTITSPDGATTLTFEFEKLGGVTAGNVPVNLVGAVTVTDVRDAIFEAIEMGTVNVAGTPTPVATLLGLAPRKVGATRVQIGSQAGTVINAPQPTLDVVGVAGGVADGDLFRYQAGRIIVQFEFDSDGVVDPATNAVNVIPLAANDTPDTLSQKIVNAVRVAGLDLELARVLEDGRVHLGGNVGDILEFSGSGLTLLGEPGVEGKLELTIPAAQTGAAISGETIVITSGGVTGTFLLTTNTTVAPSPTLVLLAAGDDASRIAASLAGVVRTFFTTRGVTFNPAVQANVITLGEPNFTRGRGTTPINTTIDLTASTITSTGVGGGAIAVPFIPTDGFTSDTVAGQIIAAITDSGLRSTAFAPGGGTVWLDNTTEVVGGVVGPVPAIRDLAGNNLAANRPNRETQFTILMPGVELDFGDATQFAGRPGVYPTAQRLNGARHTLTPTSLPRLGGEVDREIDSFVTTSIVTTHVNATGAFVVTTVSSSESSIRLQASGATIGDLIEVTAAGLRRTYELVAPGSTATQGDVGIEFVAGTDTDVTLAQKLAVALTQDTRGLAPQSPILHTTGTAVVTVRVGADADDNRSSIVVSGTGGFAPTPVGDDVLVALGSPLPMAGDMLVVTVGTLTLRYELILAGAVPVGAVPVGAGGPTRGVLYVPGEPSEVLAQRVAAAVQADLAALAPRTSLVYESGTSFFTLRSVDDEDGVGIGTINFNGVPLQGVFVDPADPGAVLSFLNPLATLGSELVVETTGGGLLDAWVDFNGDGDFNDPNEKVLTNEPVIDGVNRLRVFTPTNAGIGATSSGLTWARFRISATGNLLPTGLAIGGEVEDYQVVVARAAVPVSADDAFTFDEDPLTVSAGDVSVGDNSNGASSVRYVVDRFPSNGTLTLDPLTGQFTYQSRNDFYGDDFFTYRIEGEQDVAGVTFPVRSELATVALTITPINDPPFAVDSNYVAVEPTGTDEVPDDGNATVTITAAELLVGALAQDDQLTEVPPWNESEQSLRVIQISVTDAAGMSVDVVPMMDAFTAVDGVHSAVTHVDDTSGVFQPSGTVTVTVTGGEVVQVVYTAGDFYNTFNPLFGLNFPIDGFDFTVADDGATTLPNGQLAVPQPADQVTIARANITVITVNDPPLIDPIADLTIAEDTIAHIVPLTGISAGVNEVQPLMITTTSSNLSLIDPPLVIHTEGSAVGSLQLDPKLDQNGTSVITVTVLDAGLDGDFATTMDNLSTTITFTLTVTAVNDAPTIDPIDSVTIDEGEPSQTVNVTGISAGGGESQPISVAVTSSNVGLIPIPSFVYESPESEVTLFFEPVPQRFGSSTIVVIVTDGGEDGDLNTASDNAITTETFVINVSPVNDAPTLAPIADRTINEDAPATTVPITGISNGPGETGPLRVTATSSNPALIVNPVVTLAADQATGSLRLVPVANQFGSTVITVTVTDGGIDGDLDTEADNASISQSFTVTVNPVNDVPTIAPIANILILEEAPAQTVMISGITAGGGENDILRVTATSSNGLLIGNPTVIYTSPESTGSLVFEPAANGFGTTTITVSVTDGGLDNNLDTTADNATTMTSFIVTVVNTDDPPTPIDDVVDTDEDSTVRILASQLIANDLDPDLGPDMGATSGERLSIVVPPTFTSTLGATLTFNAATGELTYDPRSSETLQRLTPGATLQDSFTYGLTDVDGESPLPIGTVFLNVAGVNDAPRVVDDVFLVPEGISPTSPLLIFPLTNDTDIDGTLDINSLVITQDPLFGTLARQVLSDGRVELAYSPSASFTGNDSFRYTIADNLGQNSSQATVLLQSSRLPQTDSDFLGGVAAGDLRVNVLANDFAVVGSLDFASLRIATQGVGGIATAGSDGTIRYAPNPGFIGADTFQYTVSDTLGNVSAPQSVRVVITPSGRQNPMMFEDVDANGRVTALDALLIINRLGLGNSGPSISIGPDERGPEFYDVNGSMTISALDALLVINRLGQLQSLGEGEFMVPGDVQTSTLTSTLTSTVTDAMTTSLAQPIVADMASSLDKPMFPSPTTPPIGIDDGDVAARIIGSGEWVHVDDDVIDLLAISLGDDDDDAGDAGETGEASADALTSLIDLAIQGLV